MKNYRIYYILAFIFILLTEVVGGNYRKVIYSNNIFDYGIADMYPNVGAVLVASFLFMGIAKYKVYKDELKIILCCVGGFNLYEFFQMTRYIGTFDIKDIVGTFIGGILAFGIHKLVHIKFPYSVSDF